MTLPAVHSFYRDNISAELVAAQARVFDHFGIPLHQWRDNKQSHAGWMANLLGSDHGSDVAIIADIDAFPLSRAGYDELVNDVRGGALVGAAQVANHKDPNRIYAGPCFLGLPAHLYKDFGSPDLERNETVDVAQVLTDLANAKSVPTKIIPPTLCIQPRWALADLGVFGIGTFYGDHAFFHLFESRKDASIELFCAVAEGTISGKHNYQQYLDIMAAAKPTKKKWYKIL